MSTGYISHLAVALDGAGWHPAAWRGPEARPAELFSARYWADLVSEAEHGLVDFVTIEDGLGMQSSVPGSADDRVDQVRGRLDAVLIAARVAPVTKWTGIVPTATVTHTEPFHISKAIATLDYVSSGRAGWRAQVSPRDLEAAHFGRRLLSGNGNNADAHQVHTDLLDEAADFVEVVRRLWDSWEDDAEIRDASTGRFIDRDKLHYIDFEGRWFKVKGPSITPRPPQGQPLVTALAHGTAAYRFAARSTDVVYITPLTVAQARETIAQIRRHEAELRSSAEALRVFADLVVFLDEDEQRAKTRKARLDALDKAEFTSDALVFVGSPSGLADQLLAWSDAGIEGFRLRPGTLPHDLVAITRSLVPLLQRRNAFHGGYEATTLRERLGLLRPTNRYVSA